MKRFKESCAIILKLTKNLFQTRKSCDEADSVQSRHRREVTSRLMIEVLKMSGNKDILPDYNEDYAESVRSFYIIFLRGISTSKGLELINKYDARLKNESNRQ